MGQLFVISAPSGTGKTSLVKALLDGDSRIARSVSHTTRPKRPNEIEGVHYYFVTVDEFNRLAEEGAFLEHAEIYGNRYGTSEAFVRTKRDAGYDLILEIDVQGAEAVARIMPCVRIFILPPSKEALEKRLELRNQDAPAEIARRIAAVSEEVSHYASFDYLIINDDFEEALSDLKAVIRSQHLELSVQAVRHESLITKLLNKA